MLDYLVRNIIPYEDLPRSQSVSSVVRGRHFFKTNTHQNLYQRRAAFLAGTRPISMSRLNTLLCFHLTPINLIISQGT
jgi:hypothetical protein